VSTDYSSFFTKSFFCPNRWKLIQSVPVEIKISFKVSNETCFFKWNTSNKMYKQFLILIQILWFKQIELPTQLLNYFSCSNKSHIIQSLPYRVVFVRRGLQHLFLSFVGETCTNVWWDFGSLARLSLLGRREEDVANVCVISFVSLRRYQCNLILQPWKKSNLCKVKFQAFSQKSRNDWLIRIVTVYKINLKVLRNFPITGEKKETHYVKLGNKRRQSSKRNYYISPKVIIKAIIIIRDHTFNLQETGRTQW